MNCAHWQQMYSQPFCDSITLLELWMMMMMMLNLDQLFFLLKQEWLIDYLALLWYFSVPDYHTEVELVEIKFVMVEFFLAFSFA